MSLKFKLKEHTLLKNQTIRNLRIVKQAGIYYAVFTVKVKLAEEKPLKSCIAFDPNHKNLCYGVDTEGKSIEVAAPNWLKAYDKRIDELKSKRDRCLKKSKKIIITDAEGHPLKEREIPSKRWLKYQVAIEKARHKRQEQTKTYVYTLAHQICKNYDIIGIGNYAPQGEGITSAMILRGSNSEQIASTRKSNWGLACPQPQTCSY